MPVTVHPPHNVTGDPVVEDRGADWKLGGAGSLQIVDSGGATVSEFASGQWGWVEKS